MKRRALFAVLALLSPAFAVAQNNDATPAPASLNAHYTLQTPIKDLIADPAAKAVLDKDLPGMSVDPNLVSFQDMSLRALKPHSGGQLTDQLMKKVAVDLAALPGDDQAQGDTSSSESSDKASPAVIPSANSKPVYTGR